MKSDSVTFRHELKIKHVHNRASCITFACRSDSKANQLVWSLPGGSKGWLPLPGIPRHLQQRL